MILDPGERPMKQEKTFLFDRKENIKKALQVLYGICALLLIADFIVHRHVIHDWEKLSGFYAVFGFVACVSLVLIAKGLRKLVMRREDYYGKEVTGNDTGEQHVDD
jgi:hypothetical protein